MEELRFIIKEINSLFDSDYNMLSFGSLPEVQLLQVLVNVLVATNAMPEIDVAQNKEQSIMNLLMALQSIKYVPDKDISASEFRDGLIMGRRNIVHPILYWILSNMDKVKKRVYFAKFVKKVDIPPELIGEPEVNNLTTSYDRLIEEFWISYNENSKEKKHADESSELQEDTRKMSSDMTNLMQRLDMQNEKLKNVPNREKLIHSVRSYRSELRQKEKLQDQLRDLKNLLLQMDTDIKTLEARQQKIGRRSENSDPIQQIQDELQINKILVDGRLPKEQDETLLELQVFQTVAQEMEPTQEELDNINTEMDSFNSAVQSLLNKKMTLTNFNDDQLLPFRNQAAMINNRKQELTNFVMKVKAKNESVLQMIDQKTASLRELVGGDVLHGDDLKLFIANLRDRSVIYKRYRSYMQGLQTEAGIATRTFEILKQQEPTINDALKSRQSSTSSSKNYNPALNSDDASEITNKCKSLYQEANSKRAEAEHIYSSLNQLRQDSYAFNDLFYEKKREFDNFTGNISDEIAKLDESFESYNDRIRNEETEWKDVIKEAEKYEIIFNKYSGDELNSSSISKTLEKLAQDLNDGEKNRKDLENNLEKMKHLKNAENDEVEQLHRINQMILFKMQAATS